MDVCTLVSMDQFTKNHFSNRNNSKIAQNIYISIPSYQWIPRWKWRWVPKLVSPIKERYSQNKWYATVCSSSKYSTFFLNTFATLAGPPKEWFTWIWCLPYSERYKKKREMERKMSYKNTELEITVSHQSWPNVFSKWLDKNDLEVVVDRSFFSRQIEQLSNGKCPWNTVI